ncbi:MAG: c-type cytochrome [Dehalococcoidia bacterium]|nr:c-type cytochrome [Dehalococcoidia bacterium]
MRRVIIGMFAVAVTAVMVFLVYPLVPAVSGQPRGTAEAGKAYWDATTTWCSRCHGETGQGAYGPDLAGRGLSFEQFQRAVRRPWGVMPAFTEQQASEQNIADLVAYFDSLPKVAAPGPWRTTVPAGAPLGQRLLIETAGCGQCHGDVLGFPRLAAGGVGADFAQFEEWVYEHTKEFPTGRMGNFSKARLPEPVLSEIWRYVSVDLGLRVPVTAVISGTAAAAGSVTYNLTVGNTGTAGKGLAAGEIYISVVVPSGSTVSSASATGYQGVQNYAPGGYDVAVWLAPRIAAGEKLTYTMTVSDSGAAGGSRAFVRWLSPTRGGEFVQTALVRP